VGSFTSDAWESIALRTIGGWLAAVDAYDATMLEAAFGPTEWPLALRRRLGGLTGVVVRLASVDAGWPPGKDDQRRLMERVAKELDEERSPRGPRIVTRYIEPAAGVLRAAVRAYGDKRGRGVSMVWPKTRLFDPQMPSVDTEKPSGAAMKPSADTKEPLAATGKPSSGAIQPSTDTMKPSGASEQPSCVIDEASGARLFRTNGSLEPSTSSIETKGADRRSAGASIEPSSDDPSRFCAA